MLGSTTENTGPSLSRADVIRDQLGPECRQFGPDHSKAREEQPPECNASVAADRSGENRLQLHLLSLPVQQSWNHLGCTANARMHQHFRIFCNLFCSRLAASADSVAGAVQSVESTQSWHRFHQIMTVIQSYTAWSTERCSSSTKNTHFVHPDDAVHGKHNHTRNISTSMFKQGMLWL